MLTPENFRKYCTFFSERFQIVTLHESYNLIKSGKIEKPLMVFSFDDGYANFYTQVFPILQELKIKAN